MKAFWTHFVLTLKLNLRNRQALILGYFVPILCLFAFAAFYKTRPTLRAEIAQVITISTLGGACFGLPTALVLERERGVWRRYRLTPLHSGWLIFSMMLARFLIVFTSAILLVLLACFYYGMPPPLHPFQMMVAFTFSAYSFLGIGLILATLARTAPAVQALGQMVFLPMILVGGVGVSLNLLPEWARKVALFLPGYYSVRAMDSCVYAFRKDAPTGLEAVWFHLVAMFVIGSVSLFCGAKMFRWEPEQKLQPSAKWWALLALVPWIVLGYIAVNWATTDWKLVPIR